MYIAFFRYKQRPQYILRESCRINDKMTHRDLFDLGSDPSLFIHYAGGNAFYFDEAIEDAISDAGAIYDSDTLEELFWPWIRPDIRQAIDTFRGRSQTRVKKKLTDKEKDEILHHVHCFDKRRAHYLKFGSMDQGPVENMPPKLFKNFLDQSRDEIEQNFFRQEYVLKPHELKSYVFTVFDLQHFFQSFMAKKMPHVLDQEKVDTYFVDTLCRLNKEIFNKVTHLDDYLIRYVTMFFDHQYANTTLLDDFTRAFMNRHRFFKPKPKKSIKTERALNIFSLTQKDLKHLTKKKLTRKYHRLARKMHPDIGGSHDAFVELNNAFESLMEKIS